MTISPAKCRDLWPPNHKQLYRPMTSKILWPRATRNYAGLWPDMVAIVTSRPTIVSSISWPCIPVFAGTCGLECLGAAGHKQPWRPPATNRLSVTSRMLWHLATKKLWRLLAAKVSNCAPWTLLQPRAQMHNSLVRFRISQTDFKIDSKIKVLPFQNIC